MDYSVPVNIRRDIVHGSPLMFSSKTTKMNNEVPNKWKIPTIDLIDSQCIFIDYNKLNLIFHNCNILRRPTGLTQIIIYIIL